MEFLDVTATPDVFFKLLPQDWKEAIVPYWTQYTDDSKIYILKEKDQVLGGGILFGSVSPDTLFYKKEAQEWFDKGYLYIGFLWIQEYLRGKNLGSKWLSELYQRHHNSKFWLAIEDAGLQTFYEKNGFSLVKSIQGEYNNQEWIMCRA